MLAQENLSAQGDGNGVLQVTADRQHGRQVARRDHRQRSVSTRAAQNLWAVAGDARYGIIARPRDCAIV